ncbi:MAG: hypothetical protein J6V72_16395 [Kiritimatiellae bacterium]|nr:hypothetical protein [Kiritimatiellia bacterium]
MNLSRKNFLGGSSARVFMFAYKPGANDEGGTVLSKFFASIGTTIIVR